jgi:hypothetical protein
MSDLVPSANAMPMAFRLSSLRNIAAQPAVYRALPALGGMTALLLAGVAWYSFQSPTQRAVFEGLADGTRLRLPTRCSRQGLSTPSIGRRAPLPSAKTTFTRLE